MAFVVACNVSLPTMLAVTPTPFSIPTLTPTPTELSSSVSPSATQLSAHDIAKRAAVRMAKVETFHFSVRPSGSKPNIGSPLNLPLPVLLTGIEGDVVRPDQLRARVTVTILGASTHLELVRYQGRVYLNNPLTGKWEKLSPEISWSISPSVWFNPEQGLPALLAALEWHMVGSDEVQGVPAYHLQARGAPGVNVTTSGEGGGAVIDVWVGKQTFLLYQAQIEEQATENKEAISWFLTLSAFDRPVVITPPAVQ